MPLRPALVHAHQVLREVGGVGAARLRVDRDQGLAYVVLPGQEGTDLEPVDLLAQGREVMLRLGPGRLVVLALGQLEHHPGVVESLPQALQPGQLALNVGEAPGNRLGVLLIAPQVRVGGLLTQALHLNLHSVGIKNRRYAGELRRQFRDLISGICCCHGGQPMRAGACWRMPARQQVGPGILPNGPVRGPTRRDRSP